MIDLLDWQCKCGTVYGLERNVPVKLHHNHPERAKCRKRISENSRCGEAFPDQTKRDEMINSKRFVLEE